MAHHMISNMGSIKAKFPVSKLLAALKKFAKEHDVEYVEALDGYREQVVARADEYSHLAAGTADEFVKFDVPHNFGLSAPVNCAKEYAQLINIFSNITDKMLELEVSEATRILNNSWDWVMSSSAINSTYSKR